MVGDQSPLQLLGFPIGGDRFVVTPSDLKRSPNCLRHAPSRSPNRGRSGWADQSDRKTSMDARRCFSACGPWCVSVSMTASASPTAANSSWRIGVVWGVMQKFGPDLVGARQKLLGQGRAIA